MILRMVKFYVSLALNLVSDSDTLICWISLHSHVGGGGGWGASSG